MDVKAGKRSSSSPYADTPYPRFSTPYTLAMTRINPLPIKTACINALAVSVPSVPELIIKHIPSVTPPPSSQATTSSTPPSPQGSETASDDDASSHFLPQDLFEEVTSDLQQGLTKAIKVQGHLKMTGGEAAAASDNTSLPDEEPCSFKFFTNYKSCPDTAVNDKYAVNKPRKGLACPKGRVRSIFDINPYQGPKPNVVTEPFWNFPIQGELYGYKFGEEDGDAHGNGNHDPWAEA